MLVVQSFIKAIQALYAEFFNCIVQNIFAPFLSSSVNLANLWSDWFWLFYDDVIPGISQCWITAKLTAKVVKLVNNSLIDQAKFVDMSITTDSDGRLILNRIQRDLCVGFAAGEEISFSTLAISNSHIDDLYRSNTISLFSDVIYALSD